MIYWAGGWILIGLGVGGWVSTMYTLTEDNPDKEVAVIIIPVALLGWPLLIIVGLYFAGATVYLAKKYPG